MSKNNPAFVRCYVTLFKDKRHLVLTFIAQCAVSVTLTFDQSRSNCFGELAMTHMCQVP